MIEVPLANGRGVALVDDTDADLVLPRRWHLHPGGYAATQGGRVLMHRLIMAPPGGLFVDHVNHEKLDNRRSNLRLATPRQSAGNVRLSSRNTSGFKGVSWHRKGRKWVAHIRGRHLGLFADPIDAARAYDAAAIDRFGEFAKLNFPTP